MLIFFIILTLYLIEIYIKVLITCIDFVNLFLQLCTKVIYKALYVQCRAGLFWFVLAAVRHYITYSHRKKK